ncbi:hypothetical protein SASPL_103916 [Salvia splendens]|uniref:Uncharacterized protein n=1 Tax=Salvia splendens TaxID=180675 RepID=A0A8X8YIC1_SALSN|nr:hypothetical protein SASPL_103916 [Salvia splendens]
MQGFRITMWDEVTNPIATSVLPTVVPSFPSINIPSNNIGNQNCCLLLASWQVKRDTWHARPLLAVQVLLLQMSIVFSLLLLLLLGFSFHASGARALGVVADHHYSNNKESDEKLNPDDRVSTPPMRNDASSDDPEVENESDDRDQWRVLHPKKGEAVPGFNMDYLPPKTHPPVHN